MHSPANRTLPVMIEERTTSTYFHGTASKFSKIRPAEFREDKWVFLTDNFKAAQYYSMIAVSSATTRKAGSKWPPELKRLGHVYSVIVPQSLLIADLNRTPELNHLILLEQMGFHGATFPDGMKHWNLLWNEDVLGEKPTESKETVIFDYEALKVAGIQAAE